MSITRRRTRGALATTLALGLTLALAACAPSTPAPGTSTAPSAVATDPTKELDQLTVGLAASAETLDVANSGLMVAYTIAVLAQEGLVGIDDSGAIVPALAEGWTTTDNQTFVYTLREATFSDGTPVTTDDVVASINHYRDAEKAPSTAYYWPAVKSVEATGEREVTITLETPSATFAWTPSAAAGLFIAPKKWLESAQTIGSPADLLVGTGPYTITEFVPGSHVSAQRNEKYWGTKGRAATVRLDFITDDNTRLLAFQEGSLDIAFNVPVDQADQWSKVEGARLETVDDNSWQGLMFNPATKPFDELGVRQAIAHAIDRDSITTGLLKGKATPATGITAPGQLAVGTSPEAAKAAVAELPVAAFDLDAARAALATSSVPSGFETTIAYPDSMPALGRASLAIAEQLKQIGITLEVKQIPVSEWSNSFGNGEGIQWMSYTPPVPTDWPTDWLLGEFNPEGFKNEAITGLQAEAAVAATPADRLAKVTEASKLALEQQLFAPVYWGTSTTAIGSRVATDGFSQYFFQTPWPTRVVPTA
ncbi:ABC transporter substrate-binding protein [Sanguibacter sp. A247]|uniref:ABC transporter substrate-binding protein n=1 Tax=unclassified Sanguibacter TaxID=2645534 RepID=UPI003FD83EBD